jgi:class 3 adenylate cyclase
MWSAIAGSRERTRIVRCRGFGDCAATSSIPPSPRIMGASSSAPATAVLLSFAAWSTPCAGAIEVQNGMVERNAGLPPERRIEFRVGIHLGDVVEEADGDLMGDGVNIAARLEGIGSAAGP